MDLDGDPTATKGGDCGGVNVLERFLECLLDWNSVIWRIISELGGCVHLLDTLYTGQPLEPVI